MVKSKKELMVKLLDAINITCDSAGNLYLDCTICGERPFLEPIETLHKTNQEALKHLNSERCMSVWDQRHRKKKSTPVRNAAGK